MAVELFAGNLTTFELEDSMAREMEDALNDLIGPLPAAPQKMVDDRRALFIAIARGVINHLQDRQDAFVIPYNTGSGTDTTTPDIQVRT